MSFQCYICSSIFTQKSNLTRHLSEKRCKSELLMDLFKLNDLIKNFKNTNGNGGSVTNSIVGDNNVINNINIQITINPINKLNTSYIEPEKMKGLIENYDNSKLNLLLGDYIRDIICNKEHPENHSVKYIKKKPATYNSTIEDKDGNRINVIKNLKDSCELLTEPILETLKLKLKQCLNCYKKDSEFNDIYQESIKEIRKELNKESVKKALSSCLQNDILNDIEMKLSSNENVLKQI